jgi:hypothetical protein
MPAGDLSPGLYTELLWRIGPAVAPMRFLTLTLSGVAGITVDVARAGLASWDVSTVTVSTDCRADQTRRAAARRGGIARRGTDGASRACAGRSAHDHIDHGVGALTGGGRRDLSGIAAQQ